MFYQHGGALATPLVRVPPFDGNPAGGKAVMKTTILCGLILITPFASFAADLKPFDAKLGLWEGTTTMETTRGPAIPQKKPQISEETLAKMPPAQRAQVEAMITNSGAPGSPRT